MIRIAITKEAHAAILATIENARQRELHAGLTVDAEEAREIRGRLNRLADIARGESK